MSKRHQKASWLGAKWRNSKSHGADILTEIPRWQTTATCETGICCPEVRLTSKSERFLWPNVFQRIEAWNELANVVSCWFKMEGLQFQMLRLFYHMHGQWSAILEPKQSCRANSWNFWLNWGPAHKLHHRLGPFCHQGGFQALGILIAALLFASPTTSLQLFASVYFCHSRKFPLLSLGIPNHMQDTSSQQISLFFLPWVVLLQGRHKEKTLEEHYQQPPGRGLAHFYPFLYVNGIWRGYSYSYWPIYIYITKSQSPPARSLASWHPAMAPLGCPKTPTSELCQKNTWPIVDSFLQKSKAKS